MYYIQIHREKGSGKGTRDRISWGQLKHFILGSLQDNRAFTTKPVLDKRQKNATLALYELTIQNRIVIETNSDYNTVWHSKYSTVRAKVADI